MKLPNPSLNSWCYVTEIREILAAYSGAVDTENTENTEPLLVDTLPLEMLDRASQAVVGGLEDAFQWYGRQVIKKIGRQTKHSP